MTLRQILILITSAVVLFFSYRYYKNSFCPECCTSSITHEQGTKSEASSSITTAAGPLLFKWNSAEAVPGEGFNDLKSRILKGNEEGKVLEITGHYFSDETNNTNLENLGLARAESLEDLLLANNPDLKTITIGKLVDLNPDAQANEFESTSYRWVDGAGPQKIEIMNVDEAKILFPFNSSDKINTAEVSAYINSIARRLKNNASETVYIVGHTDSLGEPGANRRLSERRAKKIRDILRSKGVNYKQIKTRGRGEADPVAPNDTEANRQLNRRVDITVK